ncbi:hypothetical protein PIB30_056489, partial [Stylosanthes scabra]|nr:hypothetical protein [Stylosanthes scabra]
VCEIPECLVMKRWTKKAKEVMIESSSFTSELQMSSRLCILNECVKMMSEVAYVTTERPRYVRIGLEVAEECKRSNNEMIRKGAIVIGLEQTWTLSKEEFNTYNSHVEHFDWF